MSTTGRLGSGQSKDKRIEHLHADLGDFNNNPMHGYEDAMVFAENFQALEHVANRCACFLFLYHSFCLSTKLFFVRETFFLSTKLFALINCSLLGRFDEMLGKENVTEVEIRQTDKNTVYGMVQWIMEKLELHKDDPDINPFTGTSLYTGDLKRKQPWWLLDRVAHGNSAPLGHQTGQRHWREYAIHVLTNQMYHMGDFDIESEGCWEADM